MDRVRDGDALDVLRLLRALETEDLARAPRHPSSIRHSGAVTDEAIALIPSLFGAPTAEGVLMAVRAGGDQEDPETISVSLIA